MDIAMLHEQLAKLDDIQRARLKARIRGWHAGIYELLGVPGRSAIYAADLRKPVATRYREAELLIPEPEPARFPW